MLRLDTTRDETGLSINFEFCIGCGECVASSSTSSMAFDWETDLALFVDMLTEHAHSTVLEKQTSLSYLNFLLQIIQTATTFRGVIHQ